MLGNRHARVLASSAESMRNARKCTAPARRQVDNPALLSASALPEAGPRHRAMPRRHKEFAMRVEWSTEYVSPAQRFTQWREACCQHIYALTPERSAREPFRGRLQHCHAGPLDVADIHCDGHLVQRRPQDIRERPSDTYYVYLQLQDRAWFEQNHRQLVTEPGDIVIADPNLPFRTGTETTFNFRLWRVERARLAPLLVRGARELPMIKLPRCHGEAALLGSWLDGLLHTHDALTDNALDQAMATLCALVANAAGMAPEMHEHGRQGRRAAQLQRVMRQMALRSADPMLDPETLAAEFSMSLRALHQLFELSDSTFQAHLTRLRLEGAHQMLRDPACAHMGITEIGLASGFRETSTFYRRFKARYGAAPGEIRRG